MDNLDFLNVAQTLEGGGSNVGSAPPQRSPPPEHWGGADAGDAKEVFFFPQVMEFRNHCFNAWVTKSRLKMSMMVPLPASTLNTP